jgi:hypothetical protein
MEPRTRTRALTAAAVALTAGFTLATTFLPSSAHAAEPAGSPIPLAAPSITVPGPSPEAAATVDPMRPSSLDRIGAALGHSR